MTGNLVNRTAFLRTTREYPEDQKLLNSELSKSYLDTALAVNTRTIGLYPTLRPALTGNAWFISGQNLQTIRQVYIFTTRANIAHGITLDQINRIVQSYGNFTDGTNWYGLISGSNVAIAGQISFYLSPTDIIFLTGAGAPAITNGTIVLEWASDL